MSQVSTKPGRSFASDNTREFTLKSSKQSHALPGHVVAYGDDPYTRSAIAKFEEHFGTGLEVFLLSMVPGQTCWACRR